MHYRQQETANICNIVSGLFGLTWEVLFLGIHGSAAAVSIHSVDVFWCVHSTSLALNTKRLHSQNRRCSVLNSCCCTEVRSTSTSACR